MSTESSPLRFALEGDLPPPVHADPRVESLRRQLAALLDLVVLTKDGQPVEVDGFRLVAELRTPDAETYQIRINELS
jgi:hypothetical protein